MGNRLIIHVGLPKTGTTFLQRRVFPFFEGLGFIGLPFTELNHAFSQLKGADASVYDAEAARRALLPLTYGRKLVSDESLSGFPTINCVNRSLIADRLAALFPEATILLMLRGQREILLSTYKQWIKGCQGQASIGQFIWRAGADYNYADYATQSAPSYPKVHRPYYQFAAPSVHLDNFLYYELIRTYTTRFPRVEVLLFERFKRDPRSVVARIEEITATKLRADHRVDFRQKVNPGLSTQELRELRLANLRQAIERLGLQPPETPLPPSSAVSDPPDEADFLDRIAADYYRENNRRTAQAFPELRLEEFREQYPM